mmetsp:Transcript_36897/g.115976  ORF Transcript_36897/g.115976 Transcript_36897/m.115976 type:complete len:248 (+) Transcript_36897:452-1195(+)
MANEADSSMPALALASPTAKLALPLTSPYTFAAMAMSVVQPIETFSLKLSEPAEQSFDMSSLADIFIHTTFSPPACALSALRNRCKAHTVCAPQIPSIGPGSYPRSESHVWNFCVEFRPSRNLPSIGPGSYRAPCFLRKRWNAAAVISPKLPSIGPGFSPWSAIHCWHALAVIRPILPSIGPQLNAIVLCAYSQRTQLEAQIARRRNGSPRPTLFWICEAQATAGERQHRKLGWAWRGLASGVAGAQ